MTVDFETMPQRGAAGNTDGGSAFDIDRMLSESHRRCPAWHFDPSHTYYTIEADMACPRRSEHADMMEAYPAEVERRRKARMIGAVCQRCGAKRRIGSKGWTELCPRCQREAPVEARDESPGAAGGDLPVVPEDGSDDDTGA